MSNDSTMFIEGTVKQICGQISEAYFLAKDIAKKYFDTGSNTLVDALATGATPATQSSGLTKSEFVAGITLAQQVQNMIGAAVVSTGDYLATCDNLMNGSDPAGSPVSNDVEIIGDNLVTLAGILKNAYANCKLVSSTYSAAELAAITSAMTDSSSIVLGCNVSKMKLLDGMNVVNEFSNFMGGSAVDQGDYLSIVVAWLRGI